MKQSIIISLSFITLSGFLAPQTTIAKSSASSCGGKPFVFKLKNVKGKLYNGLSSVSKKPIILVYYSGYKTQDVHKNVRDTINQHPHVGKKGSHRKYWDGFAIVDYSEGWYVPKFAIDNALKKKMKKFPDATFLADRDECLSDTGSSDDCPGKKKYPYFESNKGFLLVTYKGYILKKIKGATNPKKFTQFLYKLTELAAKDTSYCDVKRLYTYNLSSMSSGMR